MRLTLSLVALALSLLTALSFYHPQPERSRPSIAMNAPEAPSERSNQSTENDLTAPSLSSGRTSPLGNARSNGSLPPLQESIPAPRETATAPAPSLPPLDALNLERDGPLGGTRETAIARTLTGSFWSLTDERNLRFEQKDQLATLEWEEVDGRVVGLQATLGEQAQALPMTLLGLVAGEELNFESFGPWERERPPLRPLEGTLQRADGRQIYYWARFHERCAPTCGLAELRFRLGASAAP